MARSEDDRGESLSWYLHLRVREELDRDVPLRELARRLGVAAPQLSVLLKTGKNGGLVTLIRFAEGSGRTPGELLDEALRWWEKSGRAYRERELYRVAEERTKPKSRRRKSHPPAAE